MIARVWYGRTRAEHADEYVELLRRTGFTSQRETEGNLGSMVLRRVGAEEAEFVMISFWTSIEAIRRFAGEDPETAVYFPEDEEYLLELGPEIDHYEIPLAEVDRLTAGS